MSKIGHRAINARLPEHEGVKQALRSAERLRAIGVTPRVQNQCVVDSWAIQTGGEADPLIDE
jgi:hypothetical protein